MSAAERARLDAFVAFSARVTAFSAFELLGTGQAEDYLATVAGVVGEDTLADLLAADAAIRARAADEAEAERLLRAEILGDEKFGPVARNIIKLWYIGTWYALPREWHDAFGREDTDRTFVVSATAYIEGLVWPAIGANPPGAKGPGYGTWALPPRVALN